MNDLFNFPSQKNNCLQVALLQIKYLNIVSCLDIVFHDKLDNIDKPIKSMSGYKISELVEICEKLAIDTVNKETNKPKCKKDLYEAIIQYF